MSDVDVNKPVTNPKLVEAITKLYSAPGASSDALFENEMRAAHFLAPVIIDPPGASGEKPELSTLPKGTTISFPMLTNSDNVSFYPAFTDWQELRKWQNKPDQQTLILSLEDLSHMVKEHAGCGGFVINPFGQSLIMTPDKIDLLLQGPVAKSYTVEKTEKVMLGEPAEYPTAMTDAIARFCQGQKQVKAAYLMLMVKGEERSLLLVVDFTGDRRTLFDAIGRVALPHLPNGYYIDMIPADSNFGKNAVQNRKPFYEQSPLE